MWLTKHEESLGMSDITSVVVSNLAIEMQSNSFRFTIYIRFAETTMIRRAQLIVPLLPCADI